MLTIARNMVSRSMCIEGMRGRGEWDDKTLLIEWMSNRNTIFRFVLYFQGIFQNNRKALG